MSRFRILAASLALLAHTFAIGALCVCAPGNTAGVIAERAEMPCHESAPGLSLASPEDCCCENNPAESGTSSPLVTRTLDAALSTVQSSPLPIPLTPALRVALPSASHRGASPPRPPLRV